MHKNEIKNEIIDNLTKSALSNGKDDITNNAYRLKHHLPLLIPDNLFDL